MLRKYFSLLALTLSFFVFPVFVSAATPDELFASLSETCRLQRQCSTTERTTLSELSTMCRPNSGTTCSPAISRALNALGDRSVTEAGTRNRANPWSVGGSCTGIQKFFPTCWLQGIAVGLGSFAAWLASWWMLSAGTLFDWAAITLVKDFAKSFSWFYGGISSVWYAFRDLANVFIVGFFTFIAISIILGLKQYGQKKLIANVLIAAALINFSLLFVNIAFTASNTLAKTIYEQMAETAPTVRPGQNQTGIVETGAGISKEGNPSRALLRAMRYDQFGDVATKLNMVGNKASNVPLAGTGVVLMYSVLIVIMFFIAGTMFFYGAILLISRFIMFIILMLTAPFAFATYIMPGLSNTTFGWSGWWSSLIRTAMLAPFMMLLLWGTLNIAKGTGAVMEQQLQGASVANIAVSAQQASGSDYVLFIYDILMLGLIYATFKLSSSFANSIGGFNLASALPAGLFAGLSRLSGAAGRTFIGAPLYGAGKSMQERAKKMEAGWAQNRAFGMASQLQNFGKKEFTLKGGALGKEINKLAGFSSKAIDALHGKDQGGIVGRTEAQKKQIEDIAHERAMSKDDLAGALKSAVQEAAATQGKSIDELKEAVRTTGNAAETMANTAKAAKQSVETSQDSVSTLHSKTTRTIEEEESLATQQHKLAISSNSSHIEVLKREVQEKEAVISRLQSRGVDTSLLEQQRDEAQKTLQEKVKDTAAATGKSEAELTRSLDSVINIQNDITVLESKVRKGDRSQSTKIELEDKRKTLNQLVSDNKFESYLEYLNKSGGTEESKKEVAEYIAVLAQKAAETKAAAEGEVRQAQDNATAAFQRRTGTDGKVTFEEKRDAKMIAHAADHSHHKIVDYLKKSGFSGLVRRTFNPVTGNQARLEAALNKAHDAAKKKKAAEDRRDAFGDWLKNEENKPPETPTATAA